MSTFKVKNILIPVDFSPTSMKAVDHAVVMAKMNKAAITLIHVSEITSAYAGANEYISTSVVSLVNFEKEFLAKIKKQLQELAGKIIIEGVEKVETISATGRVHKEIVEASKKMKADVIVMGTHGVSGFREFVMGSNAFRVVSDAECPVLSIQHHTKSAGFKNILVPFRNKPHSREKVDYAIALAKMYGAEINVLGIATEDDKAELKKLSLEAEQIKRIAEKQKVQCTVKVISGVYIADSVLKYAKKVKADLFIAMADMDKVSISEIFMGPFAQQIVNHSSIPVFSIRPTFNADVVDMRFY